MADENDNSEHVEQNAENSTEQESGSDAPAESGFVPDEMEAAAAAPRGADINLDLVLEVPVTLALQVGKTSINIRDLVSLVEGSVVELDRVSTDPMDVLVNDTLVARGEIVIVDDKFGVRLTDVINPSDRIQHLN